MALKSRLQKIEKSAVRRKAEQQAVAQRDGMLDAAAQEIKAHLRNWPAEWTWREVWQGSPNGVELIKGHADGEAMERIRAECRALADRIDSGPLEPDPNRRWVSGPPHELDLLLEALPFEALHGLERRWTAESEARSRG